MLLWTPPCTVLGSATAARGECRLSRSDPSQRLIHAPVGLSLQGRLCRTPSDSSSTASHPVETLPTQNQELTLHFFCAVGGPATTGQQRPGHVFGERCKASRRAGCVRHELLQHDSTVVVQLFRHPLCRKHVPFKLGCVLGLLLFLSLTLCRAGAWWRGGAGTAMASYLSRSSSA
jgi:hypothetical protein